MIVTLSISPWITTCTLIFSKAILARGASAPFKDEIHTAQVFSRKLSSNHRLSIDGLGDFALLHTGLSDEPNTDLHSHLDISDISSVKVAIEILLSYLPRTVNLASLLSQGQLIVECIGRVISMGGALDLPGNTE